MCTFLGGGWRREVVCRVKKTNNKWKSSIFLKKFQEIFWVCVPVMGSVCEPSNKFHSFITDLV